MDMNRQKLVRKVRVRALKVSSDGLLTLKFDQKVFYPGDTRLKLEQFNRTMVSRMQIIKAYTEEAFDLNWQLKSLKNDTAIIRLLFKDPSKVSVFHEKDLLALRVDQGR
jgi:hypothetical protein